MRRSLAAELPKIASWNEKKVWNRRLPRRSLKAVGNGAIQYVKASMTSC